ncbi:hypothetical protein [Xanthobacter sediminis]
MLASARKLTPILSLIFLSGCAGLAFQPGPTDDGLTYFEPVPYLFVSTSENCTLTATIISLPGRERSVKFNSGYGSAELSVSLQNGILTSVNQKTDTKIPETITAIGGLVKDFRLSAPVDGAKNNCDRVSKLYPIENGIPITSREIKLFPR